MSQERLSSVAETSRPMGLQRVRQSDRFPLFGFPRGPWPGAAKRVRQSDRFPLRGWTWSPPSTAHDEMRNGRGNSSAPGGPGRLSQLVRQSDQFAWCAAAGEARQDSPFLIAGDAR
ncbi:hypothetical protein KH5H1_29700 [Corallococcus caeni]|nr:hypothetical protein KH5H1_29700 [Corallococcus sp. KH5-1]